MTHLRISTAQSCWIGLFIIGLSSLALAQDSPAGGSSAEKKSSVVVIATNLQPVIVVSGHGEVEAPPDRAVVRLGVQAEAKDAVAAQNTVNEVIQKTIPAIVALGVPKGAIQTIGLNLTPIYAPQKPGEETNPPRIVGYRALNSVQIDLNADNLGLVGKVVDAGLENGANRLEGLSFELSKDTTARTRALRIAAEEARAKAQALAESLGVQLRGIDEVSENESPGPPRPMMRGMESARAMAVPTQVEPGALHIAADVTIRYRIEPGAGQPK